MAIHSCCPATEMENRVLIDALTDKYNALNNTLAAHTANCDSRLGIVEAATRQRDGDINALRTDLTIETERRENRDEALAASIETEAQRREAADSQIGVDAATRQELSEARHTLEMAITAETSRREATDANLTAEAAERGRKDTALETRIAAIESKENSDVASLSERIGDTNDAIGVERDDRIAAVAEVRTAALSAAEAIRADIGSTVNRAIADQTDALSRESQSRLTEDARLSTQISTALRSTSDTNTRLTSLTQTVADNLAEAKAYSDSNLDTAKLRGRAEGGTARRNPVQGRIGVPLSRTARIEPSARPSADGQPSWRCVQCQEVLRRVRREFRRRGECRLEWHGMGQVV